MLRQEINATIEHSCSRLDKIAVPPVKPWLQVYVQGMDKEDARVQRTLDDAVSYPPRVKLLRALREDGTWQIPRAVFRIPGNTPNSSSAKSPLVA